MQLKNKVIVVTGAGSGMGQALCVQLVRKGARVAMVDLHEKGLRETGALCGEQASSLHVLDITDHEGVKALPEAVIGAHGTVDGLINNAGIIQPFIDVKDLSDEKIRQVMEVNFFGPLQMTRAFLPHFLQRPEAHIANVSSMGGFIPFPGQTIYGASKAAVKLLTEGLYAELQGTKVGVTVIMPGAVNTHIMSNSGLQSAEEEARAKAQQGNRAISAEQAAGLMLKGIEENRFRVLVGPDARMLDKLYRLHPRFAVQFITKQMAKMKR